MALVKLVHMAQCSAPLAAGARLLKAGVGAGRIYLDANVPKVVRRRILEVAVRGSQNWHQDAVRAAYACDDEEWKLTAVFGMRYVRGFDEQILASLESKNPEIREAVFEATSMIDDR